MVPSFALKLSGGWFPDIPTRSVPLETTRESTGESEDDSAGAAVGEPSPEIAKTAAIVVTMDRFIE
jgi:hypothetical protein